MKFEIRPYISTDYDQVRQLLISVKTFDAELDTEQNLTLKLKQSPNSILVAVQNHTICGVVYIRFDGWKAFINRLAVDPSVQHQGLGSELLDEAESRLIEQGAKRVYLQFWHENEYLERFYTKNGYQLKATVKVMSKDLGAL